jgi:hypothetical protein
MGRARRPSLWHRHEKLGVFLLHTFRIEAFGLLELSIDVNDDSTLLAVGRGPFLLHEVNSELPRQLD